MNDEMQAILQANFVRAAHTAAMDEYRHLQDQAHVAVQSNYALRRQMINAAIFATGLGANEPLPPQPTANILLQTVVEFGEKNSDGRVIAAIAPAWFEILKLLKNDPENAFKIPHDKWEEIIAASYQRRGFTVTLTPRSGDFGRDVIAEKSGWGCVRFIDQVKAYKPGHLVTAEEVRALGFVLQADQRANKGIVTTTSDFAPRIGDDLFLKPFMPTRLELINGRDLLERLAALLESPGGW